MINIDVDQLTQRFAEWVMNPTLLKKVIPLIQPRLDRLSDIGQFSEIFLGGNINVDISLYQHKKLSPEEVKNTLIWGLWKLDEQTVWSSENIQTVLRDCAEALEFKLRDFLFAYYPALTGKKSATPLFETMNILGKDLVRARLRNSIDQLGGLSKKAESRLKRTYQESWKKLTHRRDLKNKDSQES